MDNDSESNVVNRSTYKRVMWERRFMVLATVLTVMCGLLFLIAIITAGWVIVSIDFAGNYTKTLYIGIWGEYVRVLSTDEGNYTGTLTQFTGILTQFLLQNFVKASATVLYVSSKFK